MTAPHKTHTCSELSSNMPTDCAACCDPAEIVAFALQAGNMSQKLQAMHHGVHELREMTQMCQSIIDAGSAGADADASQQCQRGWHLAKKCSGWANEVQVCCTAACGHSAVPVLCCAVLWSCSDA